MLFVPVNPEQERASLGIDCVLNEAMRHKLTKCPKLSANHKAHSSVFYVPIPWAPGRLENETDQTFCPSKADTLIGATQSKHNEQEDSVKVISVLGINKPRKRERDNKEGEDRRCCDLK